MKHILFFLLFFGLFPVFSESIFDSVQWVKEKEEQKITLYSQKTESGNFYKAETITDFPNLDLLFALLTDYDEYVKIFPKTLIFAPVEEKGEATVVYSKVNFFPLKNRDYHILLSAKKQENHCAVIAWQPHIMPGNSGEKECVRVTKVYGRWIMKKLEDGKMYLSVEYHNDWKYTGISSQVTDYFEKDITVDNLKTILKYADKKLKK